MLLLGASGSGKSTLLAALAGLLADDSGEREGSLAIEGRAGVLFQDPQSQIVMARAGDDVAFGLENQGTPPGQIWPRVDDALARAAFPYGRSRRTEALSGGEQQRLALAGVLALDPAVILLDEPTTNLDPAGADLVRKALGELRDRTLVLVEHRVAEVLHLVDRVVVLGPAAGCTPTGRRQRPAGARRRTGRRRSVGARPSGRTPPGHRAARRPAAHGPAARIRYPGADAATVPADVEVYAGEALAVHGPSGAGKSTLRMMLGGLLRPATGTLTASAALAGTDAATPPHRWRAPALAARIGTVFQNPRHQFLASTCYDELALGPRPGHRPPPAGRGRRHREGPAGPAAPDPPGRSEPLHALRRRGSGGSASPRPWPPRPGCCCSTSRRSVRTGVPGWNCSTCSRPCATTGRALVTVTHDTEFVGRTRRPHPHPGPGRDEAAGADRRPGGAAGPPAPPVAKLAAAFVLTLPLLATVDPVTPALGAGWSSSR